MTTTEQSEAAIFRKPLDGMTLAELRAHNDAMLAVIDRQCTSILTSMEVTRRNLELAARRAREAVAA